MNSRMVFKFVSSYAVSIVTDFVRYNFIEHESIGRIFHARRSHVEIMLSIQITFK